MFELNWRDQLPEIVIRELDQFIANLKGYLLADYSGQHKEDGSHADVTADSLTLGDYGVGRVGTWTPTFNTSNGDGSLGNGTLTGRFWRTDRWCRATVRFLPGSTTTFGTGAFLFTLPFTASEEGALYADGPARILEAGVQIWLASGYCYSTTEMAVLYDGAAAASPQGITAATPFAWANGDALLATVEYEISETLNEALAGV